MIYGICNGDTIDQMILPFYRSVAGVSENMERRYLMDVQLNRLLTPTKRSNQLLLLLLPRKKQHLCINKYCGTTIFQL